MITFTQAGMIGVLNIDISSSVQALLSREAQTGLLIAINNFERCTLNFQPMSIITKTLRRQLFFKACFYITV